MQVHFNRYGDEAFEVWILEECLPYECVKNEQFWLALNGIGSVNKSYNLSPSAGSPLGIKHSLANRQKRSLAQMGRKKAPCSEETKAKLRAANLGKTYPPEVKAKVAAAGRGRKQSEETKAKRVASNKANPWSEETRQKVNKLITERNSKEYIVWLPDFQEFYVNNLAAFCRQQGLCKTQMVNVAKAKSPHHRGWLARYSNVAREEHELKLKALKKEIPDRYIVTTPDGTVERVKNLKAYCSASGLLSTCLIKVAQGRQTHHRGYHCSYIK